MGLVIVVNVYFPPAGDSQEADTLFQGLAEFLTAHTGQLVLLGGDFNALPDLSADSPLLDIVGSRIGSGRANAYGMDTFRSCS